MEEMTFGGVMSFYMKENDMTLQDLVASLQKLGYSAKYKTLYSYRNDITVPSMENAVAVLEAFGNPLSKQEIKGLIKSSKRQKTERPDMRYIAKGLRIPVKEFGGQTADTLLRDIDLRINDLEGEGVKNFNAYITYLIKKDMSETIWSNRRGEQ